MTLPILSLRAAILARAEADAALQTLMGGTVRLHDEAPRAAEPVYALFGDVRADDWSTDLDRGHEQQAAIVVWAREGSTRTGLLVAERLAALIDDADLVLAGHRLVSLRVTSVLAGRDREANLSRVTLQLRAVTERAA
jgi:hypothetical protein